MRSLIIGRRRTTKTKLRSRLRSNMSMKTIEGSKIIENNIWRDLPFELLSSVMACLELKDSIRASVVCKSWYEAAVSVRIIDPHPWLMSICNTKNICEFYDPLNYKIYTMEQTKSLVGYIVHYSKDGWLLMSKNDSSDFVFFNPFTMDLLVLPYLELGNYYQLVGFSCAPTSSNCVVFTIKDYDPCHVTIRTWTPGQTKWTIIQIDSQFLDVEHNNVVFSNGAFYCLNRRKHVAVFDPFLSTWNVLDVLPPRCLDDIDDGSWHVENFTVGYKRDIFIIFTHETKDPMVFKLNLTGGMWEKMDTLGSLTIFTNSKSCESRTYVKEGMLRNSVYFSMLFYNEKCCVAYSFDERRYQTCEANLDKYFASENIWIQPPENTFFSHLSLV